VFATAASAQERRGAVFGEIGFASIGHADSEQGKARHGSWWRGMCTARGYDTCLAVNIMTSLN
jgi:hypothetical protein